MGARETQRASFLVSICTDQVGSRGTASLASRRCTGEALQALFTAFSQPRHSWPSQARPRARLKVLLLQSVLAQRSGEDESCEARSSRRTLLSFSPVSSTEPRC